MGFWKVVMQGPPASPYANGAFMLYLEIGTEFPVKPPSARFITPMLHPNITKHGRICHPIFDREWSGTTRIYPVLQHVWGILMSLEARDAVDPLSTLKFWTDPVQGRREVENYVARFASRHRTDLRNDIIGDTDSPATPARSKMVHDDRSSITRSGGSRGTVTATSSDGGDTSAPPSYLSTTSAPAKRPNSAISNTVTAQSRPPPLITTPSTALGQVSQAASHTDEPAQSRDDGAGQGGVRRSARFFRKLMK